MLRPYVIIFSQFSAHPLQNRQYAVCNTLIIHRLFFRTIMWASIYLLANALLYQSIRSILFEACSASIARESHRINWNPESDNGQKGE